MLVIELTVFKHFNLTVVRLVFVRFDGKKTHFDPPAALWLAVTFHCGPHDDIWVWDPCYRHTILLVILESELWWRRWRWRWWSGGREGEGEGGVEGAEAEEVMEEEKGEENDDEIRGGGGWGWGGNSHCDHNYISWNLLLSLQMSNVSDNELFKMWLKHLFQKLNKLIVSSMFQPLSWVRYGFY